jgi:hypothetical protein
VRDYGYRPRTCGPAGEREPSLGPSRQRTLICSEVQSRSADDARQYLRPRPVDRLMQGMPASGRASPRRDGCSVRRRNARAELARAAGLFSRRQPAGRYGGAQDGTPRSPSSGAVDDQLTARPYHQLALGLLPHSRAHGLRRVGSCIAPLFFGRPLSHHRVRMTIIANSETIAVTLQSRVRRPTGRRGGHGDIGLCAAGKIPLQIRGRF